MTADDSCKIYPTWTRRLSASEGASPITKAPDNTSQIGRKLITYKTKTRKHVRGSFYKIFSTTFINFDNSGLNGVPTDSKIAHHIESTAHKWSLPLSFISIADFSTLTFLKNIFCNNLSWVEIIPTRDTKNNKLQWLICAGIVVQKYVKKPVEGSFDKVARHGLW